MVRLRFEEILADFRTKLAAIEGVELADVLYEFTSLTPEQAETEQGYAYYFTGGMLYILFSVPLADSCILQ